ncbi:MAG: hypothetical protein EOO85_21050 [Pedobacter sp.]|nr:MAG: hypothetical protein EOO85_21050 [Pedobacter sp.]
MCEKILILSDDDAFSILLQSALIRENFHALVTDRYYLSDSIRSNDPELLVLYCASISDRRISITELVQTCKNHQLPFILISDDDKLESYAIAYDAIAYIAMPLIIDDFINTVKDVLSL